MEIIIIAAMANNRVIGKNNSLPWSFPQDLKRFKTLTKGFPCIMGRKTWESLPKKPLPDRFNIIISGTLKKEDLYTTEDTEEHRDKIEIFSSLSDAIEHCKGQEKVFICGGSSIYKEAMEYAGKIELTQIHKDYEGDVYFPEIDSDWKIINKEVFDTFSFITYTKQRLEL